MKTIPWNKANNQIPVKNTEDCCALRCCGIFLVCFYFKLELFYKVLHCLSYFALICHYETIKLFGFYTCPENEKQMRNFFYLILNCLSGLFFYRVFYITAPVNINLWSKHFQGQRTQNYNSSDIEQSHPLLSLLHKSFILIKL